MKGFWLGPMDPIAFLKSFMHIDKRTPERKLSKAEFQSVPTAADDEQEMYEPLVSSVSLCPRIHRCLIVRRVCPGRFH